MGKNRRGVAAQGRLAVSVALGVLLLLQSTGCMFFRQQFRDEAVQERAPGTLSPSSSLSQSETAALLQQALNDPSFQEVRAKLVARGYSPLDTPALALHYDQGALLLVPFAQASSAGDQRGEEQPGLPVKPSSRPPTPKPLAPPPPSAYPAYIVYIAYSHGGKEVFGVIDEGTKALHIFPEDERSLVLVEGDVLPQLRGNERFRKFEASITQMGGALGATTLVDEGRRTAYLILSVFTRVGPDSYSPLVQDQHYAVSAVYLATCSVRSWGPTGVILDSATLEVFQGSKLDQDAYTAEGLAVERYGGTPIYTVIAGGAPPVGAGDLHGFAFYTALPDYSNHITGGGTAPTQAGSNGPRALTLFCWRLLDAPPDNVLLQFKTDAELTLEAYNRALKSPAVAYGAIACKEPSKETVCFAGFKDLTLRDCETLYTDALAKSDPEAITVPLEAMVGLLELQLGLSLEQLAQLLTVLAAADRKGIVDETYAALLPQGLERLEQLLRRYETRFDPALTSLFVKQIAQEYQRRVTSGRSLQPQGDGVESIAIAAFAPLVDVLISSLIEYLSGMAFPRFTATYVRQSMLGLGPWVVCFKKTCEELSVAWFLARDWLVGQLDVHGFPAAGTIYPHIDTKSEWAELFDVWGPFIAIDPRRAGGIVALVYDFFQKRLELWGEPVLAGRSFQHLLRVMEYVFAVSVDPKRNPPSDGWIVLGAILTDDPNQMAPVVARDRRRDRFLAMPGIGKDIAVVNLVSEILDGETLPKVQGWVHKAVETMRGENWSKVAKAHRLDDDVGFDIAAVVFQKPVSAQEGDAIRALAHDLKQSLPTYRPMRHRQDECGEAVFLIWEEEDGTAWYAYIHLLGGELSPAERERIVRSLGVGQGKVLREYNVNATPSNPHNSTLQRTTPIVLVGGGGGGARGPDTPIGLLSNQNRF